MSKQVKTNLILTEAYRKYMSGGYDLKLIKYTGTKVSSKVIFKWNDNSAYTYPYKDGFTIVIGAGMVANVCSLPEVINKEQLKEAYPDIEQAVHLLFCHEVGHNKYTDMADPIIINYPEPQYRGFLQNLFNIIEDPVIEIGITDFIKKRYPYDRVPHFEWLISRLFRGDDYVYEPEQRNFLNYLLLVLRIGKKNIKNSNPIFEKYKDELLPRIKECLYEKDGTQRLYKIVALGEWIIKNITEFNWEYLPCTKPMSGSKPKAGKPSKIGGKAGSTITKRVSGETEDEAKEEKEEEAEGKDESSSGGESDEIGSEDSEEEKDSGVGAEEDEKEDPSLSSEAPDLGELEDYFGEDLDLEADKHVVEDVSEKVEIVDEDILNILQERIDRYSSLINSISKGFNLLTARKRPIKETGFISGKFDINKAIQTTMRKEPALNIWSRSIPRGEAPDPVVSIICDNSGSMAGDKAQICCDATLGLAAALDKAHIPFETWAFTKTQDNTAGTSISLLFKKIEDDFNSKLPWFGLNDNSLLYHYYKNPTSIPFFYGNSEEVNINFIGNAFLKRKEKKKVMIVLCDGLTTGRREQLKSVVKNLEDKGVIVIGLGIQSSSVESYYKNNKVFRNSEELQTLPEFMIEIIQNYCR